MKKLILLLFSTQLLAAPPSGNVTLLWDYPLAERTPDISFKLYHSTNITIPLTNWVCITNVASTATNINVKVTPGVNFFTLTASNFWGESDFSNVAATPAMPRSNINITIKRTD